MRLLSIERLSVAALVLVVACIAGLITGCTAKKEESASTSPSVVVVSSEKPSTVVNAVDNAISGLGDNMNDSGVTASGASSKVNAQAVTGCNEYAQPLDSNGNQMDQNDPHYPARIFFCKLAVNTGSPDSVRGTYSIMKNISCALEKAGLVFDGQAYDLVAPIDTDCFTQDQVDGIGVSSIQINVTASKPAAFNTYYDSGVVLSMSSGTLMLAVKVTNETREFLFVEDSTLESPNKTGGFAASFNKNTGELRFEARADRFLCVEPGSCGWSRHERIWARLLVFGDTIIGVNGFEGIASQIYSVNNTYYGEVSTLKGDLDFGLKGRLFLMNSNSSNDLADAALYNEVVNNKCYTYLSENWNCGTNDGLNMPSMGQLPFNLHPAANPTGVLTWATEQGLDFTTVTFDDVQ